MNPRRAAARSEETSSCRKSPPRKTRPAMMSSLTGAQLSQGALSIRLVHVQHPFPDAARQVEVAPAAGSAGAAAHAGKIRRAAAGVSIEQASVHRVLRRWRNASPRIQPLLAATRGGVFPFGFGWQAPALGGAEGKSSNQVTQVIGSASALPGRSVQVPPALRYRERKFFAASGQGHGPGRLPAAVRDRGWAP